MITHGTPSSEMIFFATVVFPEALPPQIPFEKGEENRFLEVGQC